MHKWTNLKGGCNLYAFLLWSGSAAVLIELSCCSAHHGISAGARAFSGGASGLPRKPSSRWSPWECNWYLRLFPGTPGLTSPELRLNFFLGLTIPIPTTSSKVQKRLCDWAFSLLMSQHVEASNTAVFQQGSQHTNNITSMWGIVRCIEVYSIVSSLAVSSQEMDTVTEERWGLKRRWQEIVSNL